MTCLLKLLASIYDRNWFGALLAILMLASIRVAGQFTPADVARSDFWVPDGVVHAILETNGVIYLGGEFTSLSPNAPAAALLNAVNGRSDVTFPAIHGTIYSAIPDGAGGWYVGGRFNQIGHEARTNLAHLLADNSLDAAWAPQANDAVQALKQVGGVVYVGGEFSTIAGQPRRNLAALDATSGAVLPWNPDVCCDLSPAQRSRVLTLEGSGNQLYIGGFFNQIDGQSHHLVAALDIRTGAWLPWPDAGLEPGSFVSSLRLFESTLFVGGRFFAMGGAARQNIAAVDAQTGLATAWHPGTDGEVYDLAVRGRHVYVAGRFFTAAGQPRFNLASIDFDSGEATDWSPDPDDAVRRLSISGNIIYVGGDFSSIAGQTRPGLAALHAELETIVDWMPAVVGRQLRTLALNGDRIFASSELRRDSKPRRRLAALDQQTGRVLDWNPGADNAVFTLAYANNTLFIGGDFLSIGDVPRARVAAVDSTTGEPLSWNSNTTGPNGRVWALAVANGRVHVAGGFSSVNGTFSPGLAALDLTSGVPVNWRPVPNRAVLALEASGNTLYAAGGFSTVAGQSRRAFAEVNALTPTATSWNPDVRGSGASGNTITRHGGTVYLGGSFANIAGQPRRHLVALNASNAALTAWKPTFGAADDLVEDVAATDEAVYVAGTFSSVGGKPRSSLAALDPQTAAALDWNPDPANDSGPAVVQVVTAGTGAIYAGGIFTSLGGKPHRHFAAFAAAGAPVITQLPIGVTLKKGQNSALVATVTGPAPLSLQWQLNGTNLPGAVSATLPLNNAQATQSGDYTLTASNVIGVSRSAPVSVLVTEPLGVSRSLGNISASPGTNIIFTIGITGSPPPRFQWKLNGIPIPGALASALAIDNVGTADSGIISVTSFNGIETIESARSAFSVNGVTALNVDAFASRFRLTSSSGTIVGNNGSASREPGEPFHAGKPGGRSLWYSWVAPAHGIATLATRGSAFDTLLAVYTNLTVSGTNLVASDDDQGGFLTSAVAFNVEAGREYQIALDGYAGASGRVVLSWNFEPAADVLPRIVRQPSSLSVTEGATAQLSVSATGLDLTYHWYRNGRRVPDAAEAILVVNETRAHQVGSYTVVVRSGGHHVESVPASLELGDSPFIISQEKFQDLFVSNATMRVLLNMGTVGHQLFDNTGSTTQSLEPNHGNFTGGASRWVRFRATTNVLVQFDTIGSEIDTTLGIYAGTNLNLLTLIARDDNGAPDMARSLIRLDANSTLDYQVAVDGVNGAQGRIQLNWQLGVPPVSVAGSLVQAVPIGSSPTLIAGLAGASPAPSFQWRLDGLTLLGATNASLTLSNFQATQAGAYSVIVSNFAGAVTNPIVSITAAPQFRLNYSLVLTGGVTHVRLTGPLPNHLAIEATTNLIQWSELQVQENVTPLDFTDLESNNSSTRFYRALLTPPSGVLPGWMTNGGKRSFRLHGVTRQQLIIERSADFATWLPLRTNNVFLNLDFTDLSPTNFPRRFYRVRPVP